MHIILGATGHVGSALAQELLGRHEPVTVVTRDATHTEALQKKGAHVAVIDVCDSRALRAVFAGGQRLFLLNPPAAPSGDASAQERKTLYAILAALEGVTMEKIVAQSTYGAQPGDAIGDLGVLHEMEQLLKPLAVPVAVIRAAYYMSNWDASLKTARDEGKVHTLYPVDFRLPMVAPHDLGQAAARLMLGPPESSGPHYVEGPAHYSADDVAMAFAQALQRPVQAVETPRASWLDALKAQGFSDAAAESFAGMARVTLEQGGERPAKPERGEVSLDDYVAALVRKGAA